MKNLQIETGQDLGKHRNTRVRITSFIIGKQYKCQKVQSITIKKKSPKILGLEAPFSEYSIHVPKKLACSRQVNTNCSKCNDHYVLTRNMEIGPKDLYLILSC